MLISTCNRVEAYLVSKHIPQALQMVTNLFSEASGISAAELKKYLYIKIEQEAVKHLPAKYQLVIDLRYIQDLSYEEIAEVLQVPLNTVKVHLNRAKKALKFYLSPL